MPEEVISYRTVNKHQRRDAANFLSEFQPLLNWRNGESFVDIGCGPGDVTHDIIMPLLPRDFTQLVCMDISRENLDRCCEEFRGDDRVSCVEIDMGKRQDSRRFNPFNHATSLMCLHWIPQQEVAIANVCDLLQSGGSFFFTFVADCPNRKMNKKMIESKKWAKFLHGMDMACNPYCFSRDPVGVIRNTLSNAGFVNIHTELREVIYQWDTREEFLDYIITFSAFLINRIPREHHAEFLEDHVEMGKHYGLIRSLCDPQKSIDPYKIIVGLARKS
ncbi:juvenile hormone acid O-methyltransferase-like [Lutzomyia longipalpis]|uniref:juvenile hormone acid O-methyltransferase-like n=1 Tax=Lutzomyia longipalpis TaxID=7200 RepID=UPI002483E662|nr:juvenile hormone acid O-methyltransferase-like [Lutzomyia longipalpis]